MWVKKHVLDTDPKTMLQVNFTGNVDWVGNTARVFINEEVKELILEI